MESKSVRLNGIDMINKLIGLDLEKKRLIAIKLFLLYLTDLSRLHCSSVRFFARL